MAHPRARKRDRTLGTGSAIASAVACGLSAAPAFGQFDFYPTSQAVKLMDIADFNLDGFPDAAIGMGGKFAIFFNRGDGTFDPAVEYSSVGGKYVMAADFNGDHAPDLMVAAQQRMELHVYLNDGNGSFDHSDTINVGKEIYAAEVGDIDDDSDMDVAIIKCWYDDCDLEWYRNDGDGHFNLASSQSLIPDEISQARAIKLADIDNDGDPDIVGEVRYGFFIGEYYYGITIFRNQNGGRDWDQADFITGPDESYFYPRLDVGDIDNDGDIDIAAQQNNDWKRILEGLSLLNDGDGNFGLGPVLFESPEQMANGRLPIADLDLDGDLDMVATLRDQSSGYRSHVYAFINLGDLKFNEAFHYAAPTNWGTGSSLLEDINGDGMRDLLMSVDNPQPGLLVMKSALTTNHPVLEQDPLRRGEAAEFRVSNVDPGQRVYFLYSENAPGTTVGLDAIGGKTLDVVKPITIFGSAKADANGVAKTTMLINPATPTMCITTQAVIRVGKNGAYSRKSNFVTAPIVD